MPCSSSHHSSVLAVDQQRCVESNRSVKDVALVYHFVARAKMISVTMQQKRFFSPIFFEWKGKICSWLISKHGVRRYRSEMAVAQGGGEGTVALLLLLMRPDEA